jgi:hypothetical protein
MLSYWLLKQVVHIVTTGLSRVKYIWTNYETIVAYSGEEFRYSREL